MATTVLSEQRFHAVNLGPNTPIQVLAESACELHAKLVWIAFTAPLPRAALETDLQKATSCLGRRKVQFVLGGQATHRFREKLGSDVPMFVKCVGRDDAHVFPGWLRTI